MNDVQKLIQLFGHYKGCQYFLESVQLVLQDEAVLTAITKEVYIPVAKKYHTSYHCVERNIRTLCERAWEKAQRKSPNSYAAFLLERFLPTVSALK